MHKTAITLAALAAAVFRSLSTRRPKQCNDGAQRRAEWNRAQYDDAVSWADLDNQPPGYW